jgi:hypothetical protein
MAALPDYRAGTDRQRLNERSGAGGGGAQRRPGGPAKYHFGNDEICGSAASPIRN